MVGGGPSRPVGDSGQTAAGVVGVVDFSAAGVGQRNQVAGLVVGIGDSVPLGIGIAGHPVEGVVGSGDDPAAVADGEQVAVGIVGVGCNAGLVGEAAQTSGIVVLVGGDLPPGIGHLGEQAQTVI